MDMKRILQAMDGVSTKPVEGADSMSKFLRVVTEAEMNQPVATTAPVAPTAPAQPQATAAPAQPQVDPANYKVPSVDFLKKNYKHPADIINGASPSSSDPTRIGAWEQGSDFDELMMALNGSYYQARQADPNYKQPAFVKDDWELVQRLLGTPEGKEYAIANWIGLSDINDTSPEAEFNRAQHKEFEKQANAKILAQKSNVIKPGWKYDQELGMTPAQAELKAKQATQPQQPATVQESIDKFLSIVKKNDVSILNEGSNPHKVALPVQMAMQHYQQSDTSESKNSSLLKKYFHEVENEINEQATNKRQLMNQYASTIAKRVLVKESKKKVLSESDLVEMPAHLRNDPDGHTIIPHGGMGSGKEETWKNVSTRKLQQVIDMINSGNYSGAEHTLYKAGFLQGAVTALARYQEFKDKQGNRRMKAGKEVELGEDIAETPAVDPQLKSQFESLLSKF